MFGCSKRCVPVETRVAPDTPNINRPFLSRSSTDEGMSSLTLSLSEKLRLRQQTLFFVLLTNTLKYFTLICAVPDTTLNAFMWCQTPHPLVFDTTPPVRNLSVIDLPQFFGKRLLDLFPVQPKSTDVRQLPAVVSLGNQKPVLLGGRRLGSDRAGLGLLFLGGNRGLVPLLRRSLFGT